MCLTDILSLQRIVSHTHIHTHTELLEMKVNITGFLWHASLQVSSVTLDGLLYTQQHGGLPLVQTRDGVKLLHLRKINAANQTQQNVLSIKNTSSHELHEFHY